MAATTDVPEKGKTDHAAEPTRPADIHTEVRILFCSREWGGWMVMPGGRLAEGYGDRLDDQGRDQAGNPAEVYRVHRAVSAGDGGKMTVDIITVGKRSIYNPAHYQIKELYKNKNWLVIDLMFTWDLPKAINELEQQRLKRYDRIFIDGVGWKNLGNDPALDWDAIARTPYEQDEDYQVTKLSKGCPYNCPYCFSDEFETMNRPVGFNRNRVLLVDENMLAHPNIIIMLENFNKKRINGKVIHFEAVCGFDIRLLDINKAFALKYARFIKPRIAWDGSADDLELISHSLHVLQSAGYNASDISVFMLTNYKVSYNECRLKLKYLKERGVKINDCCYNCSYTDPIPQYWSMEEIKDFRRRARKHNQLTNFRGYDPQPSIKLDSKWRTPHAAIALCGASLPARRRQSSLGCYSPPSSTEHGQTK